MSNLRKENKQILATYKGITYIFNSIIEYLIAESTLKNVLEHESKLEELDKLNMVA